MRTESRFPAGQKLGRSDCTLVKFEPAEPLLDGQFSTGVNIHTLNALQEFQYRACIR
jgi:hypothetical protein